MNGKKNTAFLWAGIIVLVLLVCLMAYAVKEYNAQLESYYSYYQGELSIAEIKEYLPMFGTIFSTYSVPAILMLILSAVLFGTDGIIKAVKGVTDELFFEEEGECTCQECHDEEAECCEKETEEKEEADKEE